MPPYDNYDLRPASRAAVGAVERSLAGGQHSRSLVQMATGAGKTRMAVTECYRLLRYGGFNRILFLVDRNNLGDQTLREFRDFSTPDDGRKFTELYPVDKLTGAGMVDSSKVVISTIQRVWSVLRGIEVTDDDDPNIDDFTPAKPVEVDYTAALPPESFDLVIVDECHRSIYGLWRGVIEYFDTHVLGLTATPTKQTFGFFHQNLVSEYTYAQSVADGVNVDFDVYRIKTEITYGPSAESGCEMNGGSRDPAASGSDRHANSVQLPPQGPCVYAEDRCNHGEGVAGLVAAGGIADVPRAHPALVCAPRNSEQLELRCDRVVVYVEELGDGSERLTRLRGSGGVRRGRRKVSRSRGRRHGRFDHRPGTSPSDPDHPHP